MNLELPREPGSEVPEETPPPMAVLGFIAQTLQEIAGSLDVIALYCEKKGLVEGTLQNEDLEDGDGETN